MELPLDRIVIPTIGALGYGLEYVYSIMERAKIAVLSGDKILASPMICFIGSEPWRVKEAKVEDPQWGPVDKRGPIWEAVAVNAFLLAGVDILVMRHPKAVSVIRWAIAELMGESLENERLMIGKETKNVLERDKIIAQGEQKAYANHWRKNKRNV